MDPLIQQLRSLLRPEQIVSDPEELVVYECDGLTHYRHKPRAVVFPSSTEEVSEVIRLMARERVSFAPRGAGTGLSGGALAVGGGVQIGLSRMRQLLKVDAVNRFAVVQTGLVNAQLSQAVARHGLHYAPDPSSQGACTIGGNIAENAGGIHCLKYGTTTDHILGARVVMSDGEIVDLGGFGTETSGLDLLGVFVGSEGTFGIATEATVRLTPVAPSVRTLLAEFLDINNASRAVSAIIAAGIIPAALEMVDGATIRAVEASIFAAGLPVDAEAALLVELDGLDAGLSAEAEYVAKVCRDNGARAVRHAADEVERKKLWAARKGAFGAMGRIMPDMMLQDAVVPRSRLPEVLADTYRIASKYRLKIANVFHAGDGNLHPIMCYDSRDEDEVRRVREAGREIVETCVRAGGTITGEHGIGLDKSDYLPLVYSEETLRVMLQVRAAFDPSGLCNPGKVIPMLRGCGEARGVVESKVAQAASASVVGTSQTLETPIASEPQLELDSPRATSSSANLSQNGLPKPFDPEQAAISLSGIVGSAHVDHALGSSIITVDPGSADEACEVLKIASMNAWHVVPAGGQTWLELDERAKGPHLRLRTTRLSAILEHEPADLVATAGAGLTLSAFNAAMEDAGEWLPLDPPDDGRATLGGVAATGMGGAQSFAYGSPRSKVLGMSVALADGRHIRVGGRVVKNVAGYDLCKLFVGSYGTIGVITELTVKLRPRPARESTLIAASTNPESLLNAASSIFSTPLMPVAIELFSPGSILEKEDVPENSYVLLCRFAGNEETVAYQTQRAGDVIADEVPTADFHISEDDTRLWSRLQSEPLTSNCALIYRLSVLPGELSTLLAKLRPEKSDGEFRWHAGVGDGRVRVFDSASRDGFSRLQNVATNEGLARGGLFIERAPTDITVAIAATRADKSVAGQVAERIKSELDPYSIFGEGVIAGAT